MTTYTATQTVTHAMRRSGLLGDDEVPSSEQLDLANKIYTSRLASLQTRGLNLWNWTPDTVPEELFDALADYMGLFIIPTGGGPRQPDGAVLAAETTLRQLCAIEPTGAVAVGEYF